MAWGGTIPGTHAQTSATEQQTRRISLWVKTHVSRASVRMMNRKSAARVEPDANAVQPFDEQQKATGATPVAAARTGDSRPSVRRDKWGSEKEVVFTAQGVCHLSRAPGAGLHSSRSAAHSFVHGCCCRLR